MNENYPSNHWGFMISGIKFFSSIIITLLFISACGSQQKVEDRIVIGIPNDVQTFNPLYTFTYIEGNVSELMYLGLVGHSWNDETGDLENFPLLAEQWVWSPDSSYITFMLKENLYWTDSVSLTTQDIIYSFDLYSSAEVESRFYGIFDNYYTNEDLSINLDKTFEIISPKEIKFNFKPGTKPSLFDVDMPIIPKHIFEKVDRSELATSEINFKPVGNGPYKLKSWERNQKIVLEINEQSPFAKENSIGEIIFKIVPDYNSRLTQLQKGELDFIENIRANDISKLNDIEAIKIVARKGRDYDYAGWNNIDPDLFSENQKFIPHPLFGNKNVRKALTLAINREMILEEFLWNNGLLAIGPIAPIFTGAIDRGLVPYPYNPTLAKEILDKEGWGDSDNNGILDKEGREFSFTLNIPGGNPLRNSAAIVIQENLKSIGIEVKVETLEPAIFFNKMFAKELDAWIAGWTVPIPIELRPFWHSDFESSMANVSSYSNKKIDTIIDKLEEKLPKSKMNSLYKEFQSVIHDDQPVTFLYWIDSIVGYNSKIKNLDVNPLGAVHYCWEWTISG